ncbi:MAG: type II toxin-antitoxin system MqsA family antitoxin [Candidatus Omnitrophica bacterium]|nr:type II toxin-antitoxin system MqsA family antitoxin [Candidatus Omnitrophota bacterium]
MKCVVCKRGKTVLGMTTITLEKGGSTLVLQKVPAQVCADCGEAYVDEKTAQQILENSREVLRVGVKVDIREYKVA